MGIHSKDQPLRSRTVFVKDSLRKECVQCQKPFGLFRRRHHCRFCGDVFCDDCAPVSLEQPHSATSGSREELRLCADCFGTPRVLLPFRQRDGTTSVSLAQRIMAFLPFDDQSEVMVAFPDVRRLVILPDIPFEETVASVYPGIVTAADGPLRGALTDKTMPSACDDAEAKGGQGCVFFTTDPASGAQLAVKVMPKSNPSRYADRCSDKTRWYQTILREVRIHQSVTNLNNRHISPLVRVFQTTTHVVLAIVAAEAGNVKNVVQDLRERKDVSLDELVALSLVVLHDATAAVHVMHTEAGYVHRDIKLENVVLTNDYNRAQLIDFGIAQPIEEGTGEYPVTGSAQGFPPEVLRARRLCHTSLSLTPQEAKAGDVFSLGVVAYRILKGRPLYPASAAEGTPMAALHSLLALSNIEWHKLYCGTDDFRELLVSMLADEPTDRPTTEQVLAHPAFTDLAAAREYLVTRRLLRRRGMTISSDNSSCVCFHTPRSARSARSAPTPPGGDLSETTNGQYAPSTPRARTRTSVASVPHSSFARRPLL